MAAPGVVASVGGGGLERPAEIGFGEGGHILRHAEFLRGVVERRQRRAQLRVQRVVRLQFSGMRVEAAQGAEENLPRHAQIRLHLDDLATCCN